MYFGSQLRSPEQIAADTAPPEASLITVPVESRTLSRDVITRTTAAFQDSNELTLSQNLTSGSTPVITGRVPDLGDELTEGMVLLEVAGRPVFVFEGELPSFRSMGLGTEGVDVRQLEEALVRLGSHPGPADEVFDRVTEDAFADFYLKSGYQPPELTEGEKNQLTQAEDIVEQAEDAVENAQDSRADAAVEMTESQRLQTGNSIVSARSQETSARAAYMDALWGFDEDIADAEAVVKSLQLELSEAAAIRELSIAALAQPTEEQLEQIDAPVAALSAQLTQAERQRDQLISQKNEAIIQSVGALDSAERQLAAAEAQRREANEPQDFTSFDRAIEDAQERLEDAQADLLETQSDIGAVVPQSEFVFLDNLPRLVSRVDIEAGQTVTGPVMRISGDQVTFSGGIPSISRPFVAVGNRVVIDDVGTGIEIQGVISELADNAGTRGQPDSRYYFELMPEGDFDAEEVVDVNNFRLTIPIERTEGEVLAVPLAALSAGADGSSRVEVALPDGSTELVTVAVGLEADGFAEIEPAGREISVGEQVVVGVDRSGSGSEGDDGGG